MSRLLVLGFAPLPVENPRALTAINRRTWHIARAVAEDGHDVLLLAVRPWGAYPDEASLPAVIERRIEPSILYRAVSDRVFRTGNTIQRWVDEFAPEAIVAAGPRCGYRVTELGTEAPLWADLYGYLMGEAQAAAFVHDDDSHLAAWHRERATLQRADVFSTCSLRQRYAVIGELGAVGRLNKATAGYDFVHVLPSAVEPEPYQHTRDVVRGVLADADDFIVLFAGGYNTWTDVDLLFEGVTRAMRRNRRVKFVSTGGALKGHDEHTFAHFRELVSRSPFADRFIFVGWVPTSDVPNYYLEADAGVNVDKFNYETLLGTRYRVTDMCKAGLPIITTSGTEISGEIARAGLGLTCRIGDPDGLANAILRLASDPPLREEMRRRAAPYAMEHWAYSRALEPLRDWARAPTHAPDFGHPTPEAVVSPGAEAFRPRSRLTQLAWLIETEGYARAGIRTARALCRGAFRLPAAVARGMARLGAKAFLERRPVPLTRLAAARPLRVLIVQAADVTQTVRALGRLRQALPDVDIIVLRREGEVVPQTAKVGARVIGAPREAASVRGFLALAGRLRREQPDAVVVVGLGSRRAEVLAWLVSARVYLFGDDARLYASVVAPWKLLVRGVRRLVSLLEKLTYASLMGLVILGLGAADAVAAIGRLARHGRRRTTEV